MRKKTIILFYTVKAALQLLREHIMLQASEKDVLERDLNELIFINKYNKEVEVEYKNYYNEFTEVIILEKLCSLKIVLKDKNEIIDEITVEEMML